MTSTLAAGADVRPLPDESLMAPQVVERITPLVDAFGLEPDSEPSFLRQAKGFVASHPNSSTAWARLAQAAQSVGNSELAAEAAMRALDAVGGGGSTPPITAYVAAAILSRNGEDRADALFEAIDHPMARVSWAGMAVERGEGSEALRRLSGITTPAAHALRAYCLVTDGKYDLAVKEYRAVRSAGRASLDVLINLGFAFARLGSLDKAIRTTQRATMLAPRNTTASYNLTRFLLRRGDSSLAVRELDRLASMRTSDYKVTLYRAWAHANAMHDTRKALSILVHARAQFSQSGNDVARAEIAASIAYLQWQMGELPKTKARRALWSSLRLSGTAPTEIVRMLASLLDRRSDVGELEELLETTGPALDLVDRRLLEARQFLLGNDIDSATSAAVEAAELDPQGETDAAGTAAYLVGEVRGDYERAAGLAAQPFLQNPNEALGNNYAFSLALAGNGGEALRVLARFEREELPYHGATMALAQLALGDVSAGLELYGAAEDALRADGDSASADYVATRARLALRQFGIEHAECTTERILASWPQDRDDPRWAVMRRVAERVGMNVADDLPMR